MSRPSVTSNFISSPIPSPTGPANRIPAIIGEGSLTFTVNEKDTRLALATPAAPVITNAGTPGAATWSYKITAVNAAGETFESPTGSTTTGNTTLDVTNYNVITWAAVPGAASYNVYRTVSGGTPSSLGLIGNVVGLSLNDTGLAASTAFPGSTDVLGHPPLVVLRVGNFQTTTDYASGTDYTVGATGIVWLAAGHHPMAGGTYYVTYTYAKVDSDFEPAYFTNFNDILNAYGPITLDADGNLTPASYITMAASLMMGGAISATQLIVVQISPATAGEPVATDFTDALVELESAVPISNSVPTVNVNPYYITPLGGKLGDSDVAVVNAACLNHAILMADPQYELERRIYTGLKNNSSYAAAVAAANGLQSDQVNSGRLTLMSNFDPLLTISYKGGTQQVLLDGFFAAAALAGYRSTQEVSQPAVNKLIPVFDGFATTFNSVQVDSLDDNGLEIFENDGGAIKTVNDVTVNVVNDIEKSIPTVETRDDLISRLRKRLYSRFIGLRGSLAIPGQLQKDTDAYLDDERASGDILAFSPSRAQAVPNTITKFTVSFSYLPAGEVLEIKVSFSIDLSL